jgi:segregation and condensation protein B
MQETIANFVSLTARVEAMLMAARGRLKTAFIATSLKQSPEEIGFALIELEHKMNAPDRGVRLSRNQAGWRIEVKPDFEEEIARVFPERAPKPLSHQALEALAVIAYNQPLSLADIDRTRKVESAAVLTTLRKRKLVESRKRGMSGERLWSTTPLFLEMFRLTSLQELKNPGVLEKVFEKIT